MFSFENHSTNKPKMTAIRNDWTREEVQKIYHTPLMDLIHQASLVHRQNNDATEIQMCTLLSVKTGGCSEDCNYCSQSARYSTEVKSEKLLEVQETLETAKKAKEAGSTRFCMGAAWSGVKDNADFDRILEMVRSVRSLGLEVCCTLGMLSPEQAKRLCEAGLSAYNHNLDTSEEFYPNIVTTRTYQDRLDTINNVQAAGISLCSGSIIGMGESHDVRIDFLHTLATLQLHPESVPINSLVAIEGTPLEQQTRVPIEDVVRMVATARILMPKSIVRLSAGRTEMGLAEQALCFMAGANSLFTGDKLLTTPNPEFSDDHQMMNTLGLTPRQAFKEDSQWKSETVPVQPKVDTRIPEPSMA